MIVPMCFLKTDLDETRILHFSIQPQKTKLNDDSNHCKKLHKHPTIGKNDHSICNIRKLIVKLVNLGGCLGLTINSFSKDYFILSEIG